MKYKIIKLIINNFKTFKASKPIEIQMDKDIMILTGPNGYGKTTIFDAIELIITGNIQRLNSVSGKSKLIDNLLANSKGIDVILGMELKNDNTGKYLSLLKYIPKKGIKNDKENKIEKWFEGYIIEDKFDIEKLKKTEKLKNEDYIAEIKNKLGVEKEYYHIHYIQQKNPTQFMERNEEKRKAIIDKLLGLDSLNENILQKIKSKLEEINNEYKQVFQDLKTKNTEINQCKIEKLGDKPNYFKLFKSINVDWDIKKDKISDEKCLDEIDNIKCLKRNSEIFFKHATNKILDKVAKEDVIKKLFIYDTYNLKYEEIEKKQEKIKNIDDDIIKKLDYDSVKNSQNTDIAKWKNLLNEELYKELKKIRKDIIDLEKDTTESDKFIRSLNTLRKNLQDNIAIWNEISIDENRCPLCAQPYENFEELKENILNYVKHEKKITEKYKVMAEVFKEKREEMKESIKDLKTSIIDFKDTLHTLKEEEFLILKNIIDNDEEKTKIEKYIEIIKKHTEIDFNINNTDEFTQEIELTISKILAKKYTLTNDENTLLSEKQKIMEDVFGKYFNRKKELLDLIEMKEINDKKEYLKWCYENYLFEKKNKKKSEYNELINKLAKLKYKIDEINKMKETYFKKVGDYKTKVISRIEIPLYIYSGKILQTHQRGLGVFCYFGENENDITRLKFISNLNTSHDIINTFSSGQLSGFVLSFTLAMNKVYNNEFSPILIDDPVQTMDEINLSSFTEILRNEFTDKQIIMSTHEDNIAGYMLYKYKKYRINTGQINVKEQFYD